MCLCIASPTGKRISKGILTDAARTNSDGGGLAWLDEDKKKIVWRKDLSPDEVHDLLGKEVKDRPWVAHFRIATSGGKLPELTHPFSIDKMASTDKGGEHDSVLFQNGTMSGWKDMLLQAAASSGTELPPAPWSDTRAIAFLCHVYGKHILSLLDNHSRFLVFEAKEVRTRRMMLWGEWHEQDGFKFSNKGASCFTYQNGKGSGSSNFPQKEESQIEDGPSAFDDEGMVVAGSPTLPGPVNPNQSSSTTVPTTTYSRTTTPASDTSNKRIKFKPKAAYNHWQHFDQAGLEVVATNE